MEGKPHPNSLKTHCKAGHPYEGKNLRVRKDGSRACVACQVARDYKRTGRVRLDHNRRH